MKREDYEEIVNKDAPGPNADKAKAEILRSFVMPERFANKLSADAKKRRLINVLAAFVSDTDAILIIDFSRLSRLHVVSQDRLWDATDNDISSAVSEVV